MAKQTFQEYLQEVRETKGNPSGQGSTGTSAGNNSGSNTGSSNTSNGKISFQEYLQRVKETKGNPSSQTTVPTTTIKSIPTTNALDAQKPFRLNSYDTRSLGSSMGMYNHKPEAIRSLQNSMDYLKNEAYKQAIQDLPILDQLNEQYKYSYKAYERAQKEADKAKKKNKTAAYKSALSDAEGYKDTADKLRQRIVLAGGTPWEPFSVGGLFEGEDVRSTEGLDSEQRESYLDLLKQFDTLNNNAAYITTTEQSEEYEKQRSDILARLDEIDQEAQRGLRSYDARQRAGSFFKSWGQGTAAGYLNAAASVDELSDRAEEMQRDIYELNRQIKKARVNYSEAVKAYGEAGAEPEKNVLTDLQKQLNDKREQYNSMEKLDTTKRDELYERADEKLLSSQENMARAKSGASKVGTFGIDAAKTVLDIGLDTAASFVGVPGLANMAVRVYGSESQDARLNGDDAQTAAAKGLKSALIEVLTEKIGGPFEKAYGSTALGKLTDKVVSKLANKGVIEFITEAMGEGIEEGMSDVLNIVVDHIAGWDDGSKNVIQDLAANGDEMLYDMILGAAVGTLGAAGKAVNEKYLTPEQRTVADEAQKKLEADSAAELKAVTSTTQAAEAPATQNASEAPTTSASTPTSTDTTTVQNSNQTAPQGVAAGLGDMTAIYNGSKARVLGMAKMENGQYAARIERSTPSGTKVFNVTEDKLTFDPETSYLMDMVRPYAYANEMLVNYDAEANGGDKSLPAYVQAFNTVADILGRQSTLSEDEARAYVKQNKGLSATLSDSQFTAAFRAGRSNKDAHVQNSATRQGGTGKLIFNKDVTYDGTQYKAATEEMISEAEREVLQTVAKAAGVDMFFYQSDAVDGKYQGANGFYRKGTVYLDVNAGATQTTEQSAVLLTAAHELTHYLRENNAEGYAELRDFVVTHLMRDGADIEAMAEKMIRREGSYDGSFTLDDAVEEIVADSCEMMLQNTQLPQIMAQENPKLYAKVKDWLRRFVDNLRRAFEGVTARSPEARAMMEYAGELQQIWDNALADTAAKPREKRGGSGSAKHSYAGRNARTANMETLAKAEEMERNGEEWDTIRKETGWFRGMDNEWRFEINDSNMEFRKDGDAQLLAEPEYQQLISLTDKWAASFEGGEALTEAEENEMNRLEEKYGAEVWENKYMLRDFVKHDELFDAYPRLKGVGLEFDELPDGVKGFYSKRSNTIVLSESLFGKEPDVVLHEIQHVIQKIEGFTGGSSVEYWNERMENGYSKRGSSGFEMMPSELYRNTAGEIEARDTATRRKLTADERRSNAPARANEDTVFADGSERSYSIKRTKDLSLKEQLKEYYAGKFKSSDSFYFGDTPTRLSVIGIGNAPLAMTKNNFEKSTSKKHNIPRRVLKSLTDNLSNPVLAFYDKATAGILIDDVDADGKPVLVAINKKANMDRENVNSITSVYGLDNVTAWVENQAKAGKEFYAFDKKRASSFLQTYGYLASVGEMDSSNDTNVSQSDAEVNSKFSHRSSNEEMTKEQTREQQMSRAELLREVEAQRQRAEYWRNQSRLTKENTVRKTDTHRFAREMAEQLDVKDKAAIADFEDAAQYIGDYIVQSTSESMDYDTLHSLALDAADILLNKSEVEIESGMEEQFAELADYIKENKLKVNEVELNDMPEGWRRQHRQFIKLSPDGVPIDVAWQQWQQQYGEGMFPSDITAQSEMLYRLADIEQGWRTRRGNPFAENMGEMRETVAQEIIDTMLSDEIRQTAPTAADRAKAKADKRYNEMKQAERQRANERIAKVLAEGKARTREAVKAERTFQLQRTERVQKTKSIEKLRDRMIKKLTDNTGKSHVPDVLKEPVAQLLQSIDPTTSRTRQAGTAAYIKSLEKLQTVLENQRLHSQHTLDESIEDGTGADLYFDIPDGFAQQIKEYVDDVKHWGEFSKAATFKLEDMSLQELHDLENILKVVNGAVNRVNEMYTSSSTVSEVSEETMGYLDKMQSKTEAASGLERFLGFTNQTPVYYFERMGEAGKKIFKSLTDGWDKFTFYTEEILNFTETLYSRKEVREAERDIRTVQLHNVDSESGLTNENTVPVQMTRAQIMNLYGATVRGEQSINHILGGGIKLTNIKEDSVVLEKGNGIPVPRKGKNIVQPETYHLNMQELSGIINDNLTARDREIVDGMIRFLSGPVAKWGNAVSQKRWGIDLFTEESYWPIGTDRNSHPVSSMDSAGNSTSIYHLANMGFTKPLTPGANNPMIIGSAFDVFANHAADMAKYGSLVLPMLDSMKWINYSAITESGTETITLADGSTQDVNRYSSKSVRKSMDRVYGHDAQDYFVRLMRDINGQGGGRQIKNGTETWTSRYKRQAVAGNLRVAIMQPTSIWRAFHVLKFNNLSMDTLRSFAIPQNYEEAKKYSGIAKWKDMGFYDTSINAPVRSQIKHDESGLDHFVELTMKGAEMGDKLTWSILWGTSKHQVKQEAKKAGEKLSHDELMQRTNDLFTTVIYKTQVVDSPLTRSQIMRSDDTGSRMLTAFMAEPTLSYNVMSEYVHEFAREKSAHGRTSAWEKCGLKLLRGMVLYSVSSVGTAAAASIIDAMRDDDEYKTFWEKWLEKFAGEDSFLDSNLWDEFNPFTKLPLSKELYSLVEEAFNVVASRGTTNMAFEGINSAANFVKDVFNRVNEKDDLLQMDMKDWRLAYQGLKTASQLTGIPGMNLTREAVGLWNTIVAPLNGQYIHLYEYDQEKAIRNAYQQGYLDDDEVMALLMDKETMGDDVYMSEKKVIETMDDWLDGGKKYEALYAALEAQDTKAYNEAFKALTDNGRYDYNVRDKVKNRIKELYQDGGSDGIRIGKEDAIKMMQEYGGRIELDAKAAVQMWTCKVTEGFDYNETKELFYSGYLTEAEAVDVVYNYGNDGDSGGAHMFRTKETGYEEARAKVQEWKMLPETGIAFDDLRNAYNAHEITAEELKEYYIKYGSKTKEQAETYLYRLDWIAGDPALSAITAPTAQQYDAYVAGTGMSKRDYYSATKEINQFKTLYDENGEKIDNSKRMQIWEYIDGLNVSNSAKDALHLCYYAKSTLKDAPWNN